MSRPRTQPANQLYLRLERPPTTPPLTPDSQELIEALAELLLTALDPNLLKPSVKESGDES